MTKNSASTAIKTRHENGILKALLPSPKNVHTLQEEIKVSHTTISTLLKDLENKGFIKQFFRDNRREKYYKLTSKGLKRLKEIAPELKSSIFTAHVFFDIDKIFQFNFIFDSRLPEELFKEMFENFKLIYNNTEYPTNRESLFTYLLDDCLYLIGQKKIPPLDLLLNLREEFYDFLYKQIGEAILYLSIKYSEEKKPEILALLFNLPLLLANRIEDIANGGDKFKEHQIGINNQYKKQISRWNIYEDYFYTSQNITSIEDYEKKKKSFARVPDLFLLEAIGEDFLDEGIIKFRKLITIQEFNKRETSRLLLNKSYLFSWKNIPGNNNRRLIEFLTQKFGIDWVKTAKIEKIHDGKTIKVSTEKNYLSLKVNDEKTKVNLKIDDGRTDEFNAKMEYGKLNIYKKSKRI